MALWLDIGEGQELHVGDAAVIRLVKKYGRRARLKIDGPAVVDLRAAKPTPPPGPPLPPAVEGDHGRRR